MSLPNYELFVARFFWKSVIPHLYMMKSDDFVAVTEKIPKQGKALRALGAQTCGVKGS